MAPSILLMLTSCETVYAVLNDTFTRSKYNVFLIANDEFDAIEVHLYHAGKTACNNTRQFL